VAVSADGQTVVSGSYDKTVRVWDLAARQCRAILSGHTLQVSSVAVSADGQTVVSGSYDRTVRVWDLATRQCRAVHPENSPEARRAWESVHPAGALIAQLSSQFLKIGATDADAGIARFPGHFTQAACSFDGRHVIAGDGRGRVYVFRLRSGSRKP